MPAKAHPRRNSDRIAVIRSYRPVRIEHELLAQVFDLAQRGLADGSASVGGKLLAADQTADQAADERVRDRMHLKDLQRSVRLAPGRADRNFAGNEETRKRRAARDRPTTPN